MYFIDSSTWSTISEESRKRLKYEEAKLQGKLFASKELSALSIEEQVSIFHAFGGDYYPGKGMKRIPPLRHRLYDIVRRWHLRVLTLWGLSVRTAIIWHIQEPSSARFSEGVMWGFCGLFFSLTIFRCFLWKRREKVRKEKLDEATRQLDESILSVPDSLIRAATDYLYGVQDDSGFFREMRRLHSRSSKPASFNEFYQLVKKQEIRDRERQAKHSEVRKWLAAYPEDFYDLLGSVIDVARKIDGMSEADRRQPMESLRQLAKPTFDRIALQHKWAREREVMEEQEAERRRKRDAREARRLARIEAEALNAGIRALDHAMNNR